MREVKDHFLLNGQIKPGDVLMVARDMKDKQTRKAFTWRFLGVASNVRRNTIKVIRLGVEEGKDEVVLMNDEYTKMHVLDDNEWPDGARAFRTVLMMEGRLDPDLT